MDEIQSAIFLLNDLLVYLQIATDKSHHSLSVAEIESVSENDLACASQPITVINEQPSVSTYTLSLYIHIFF